MSNLQIGMNGRFFPANWRPACDEIRFAHAQGFAALQFPGKEAGLDATHLGAPLTTVAAELADKHIMAVMEIVVHVDANGRTAAGSTPLDILHANLSAITALPCRYVHWHLVAAHTMDAITNHALESSMHAQFGAAVALAQTYNFCFGFEHNEPELLLFGTPDACATTLAAVPGLAFVWDLNHTIPEHLADFQALLPRMSMLHVSDTPLPTVNYHLPLGMGTIDFRAYCQALRTGGFQGPAILEIGGLPKSGGYGRDTDEALVASQERLKAANTEQRY